MLTEMLGKGGRICQHAMEGKIRCPLIVRPTSEDVITGHLFQTLRVLNPRWWLPQMLNEALGSKRFRQQVFRNLRIELWQNKPPYPRELLPWEEGSTQVDVVISWANPPTTVFVEMKYGSDLSAKTSGDNGQHGFPSDQLVRNVRVGLLDCGYFQQQRLFESPLRDFVVLVVSPQSKHPLVAKYRQPDELRRSIPGSDRLRGLPKLPFVGESCYADIVRLLKRQRRWFSRPERTLIDTLTAYLEFKQAHVPERRVFGRATPALAVTGETHDS
jgi:hypothetical protein